MRTDKVFPGRAALAFRGRGKVVAPEDVSHSLVRQGIAQIGQRADDSIVAPADILFGQAYNQDFEFWRNAWPVRRLTVTIVLAVEPLESDSRSRDTRCATAIPDQRSR